MTALHPVSFLLYLRSELLEDVLAPVSSMEVPVMKKPLPRAFMQVSMQLDS